MRCKTLRENLPVHATWEASAMWGIYIHKTREGRQLPNGFDFPGKLTNKNHRSDKHKDFYDRFSRIIAKKSAGTVYFVAPVWKRIEYNALANNAAVVKIVQVNYKDFLSEERPMSPPKQFDA